MKTKLFFHFFLGAGIGTALLFFVIFIILLGLQKEYSDKILPNVYIFSTNVSKMSKDQAVSFLSQKEKEIGMEKIIFTNEKFVGKEWEISPTNIDFVLDKETLIKRLFLQGRARQGFKGLYDLLKMLCIKNEVKPEFVYNEKKFNIFLDKISNEINISAQDALFEFKEGKVFNFQPSIEGLSFDNDLAKFQVISSFGYFPFRNGRVDLTLPVNVVEPKIKTSDSNKLGITELLGEGESFFKDSIPTRVYNILLASSKMHGVVVPPGEVFSFAKEVGDISAETGYQKAYVIKEKQTILEDGGGVCQVSTTMFRAALNTGLPIIERQAHYYRVGFYEQGGYPPGLDATVYPPSPDFKFKNDTGNHILIQTVVDKAKKRLSFQLYGTSDGRTIEQTKPKILSQTPPPPDLYVDDPTLPIGTVKKFDSAHWGAKVSFKRTVWNSDGSTKEEKTFLSNYTPWPAVFQRGTKTN